MTTMAERMRVAADFCRLFAMKHPGGCDTRITALTVHDQLLVDADELERVEREMQSDNPSYTIFSISNGQADDWADRIRGEQK